LQEALQRRGKDKSVAQRKKDDKAEGDESSQQLFKAFVEATPADSAAQLKQIILVCTQLRKKGAL
jgi:hypothetical protein